MTSDMWTEFRCMACGWTTPGCYNFANDPTLKGSLPDTDCPKCGCHDGVVDTDKEVERPSNVAEVITDINSGGYVRGVFATEL